MLILFVELIISDNLLFQYAITLWKDQQSEKLLLFQDKKMQSFEENPYLKKQQLHRQQEQESFYPYFE